MTNSSDPIRSGGPAPEPLTRSELIPLWSSKVRLLRSRAILPIVATCVAWYLINSGMIYFRYRGNASDIMSILYVISAYLSFIVFYVIYLYSSERKSIFWYLVPVPITWLQMWLVFEQGYWGVYGLLRGVIEYRNYPDLPTHFVMMLFRAGLPEELMKATPALVGLAIALWLRRSGHPLGPFERGLALQGPLDGILVGCAAGATFTVLEVVGDHAPEMVRGLLAQNVSFERAWLTGVLYVLLGSLQTVFAHVCYAGISGYFIGLTVTHPRAWPKLLAVAWLLPSLFHAFGNSSYRIPNGAYLTWLILPVITFLACLLKAKQLEASRLGAPVDGWSILALSPRPLSVPMPAGGIVPTSQGGVSGLLAGAATAIETAVGVTARTTIPDPAVVPPHGLSLGIGTQRYALLPGHGIDLTALFGSRGVPAGCSAVILAGAGGAPTLRNTGTATWPVRAPDGAVTSVPPGAALPAAAGLRLELGPEGLTVETY